MKKDNFKFVLILLAALFFTACKKDDPVVPNEEELITTLTYTLVSTDGNESVSLIFKDLDGDGGASPEIIGGTLSANKTYNGTLELLNEIESPKEIITEEISEENDAHQFFFQSTVQGLSVDYNDSDSNGKPLGLRTVLTTSDSGSGNLTITLRHEPNKTENGVADGDISNAGGETDIEVTFPINVQ